MEIFADFDAAYGGYYSGLPAGDGTIDVLHNGHLVENVNPKSLDRLDNVYGGEDIYSNGKIVSHSQPNVYGGEDIFEGTKITHSTIPNEHGGFDIYGENLQYEGSTFPNVHGSEDFLANGNVSKILAQDDPLKSVNQLKFDSF